jgi:ATP-dependent DNA ligase
LQKYPPIAEAVAALGVRQAYLDGELCGVGPDGITSFNMIQLASDAGKAAGLVFLRLDGEDLATRPLVESKARLAELLAAARSPLQRSDHQVGHGPAIHAQACTMKLEGIVSKRADAAYAPGNRGLWLKVKCLHREEFVVVGWTDPEGTRPFLGALLLDYCDPERRLIYAGRAGTGIDTAELELETNAVPGVGTAAIFVPHRQPEDRRAENARIFVDQPLGVVPSLRHRSLTILQSYVILDYLARETGHFGGRTEQQCWQAREWLSWEADHITFVAKARHSAEFRASHPETIAEFRPRRRCHLSTTRSGPAVSSR